MSATNRLIFACGALLGATAVQAYETWANGAPIPEWVRRECCAHADAHHLRRDQVHPQRGGGFIVDGLTDDIPFWMVLPSQDGESSTTRTATGGRMRQGLIRR